jgi:hypothetical protein
VIITKLKMERYPEALDQGVLRDFQRAADLLSVGATAWTSKIRS